MNSRRTLLLLIALGIISTLPLCAQVEKDTEDSPATPASSAEIKSAVAEPASDPAPQPLPDAAIKPIIPALSSHKLNSSIRAVLENPEFAWRLPRVLEKEAKQGFFGNLIESFGRWIKSVWRPVGEWLKPWWQAFKKWLEEWIKNMNLEEKEDATSTDWRTITRYVLYSIATVSIALIIVIIYRRWSRMKRPKIEAAPLTITPIPDLEDESISATDLPVDEWLELANKLVSEGKLRHASRAIYLGMLALLEQHHLIRTARFKTNGEYYKEALRRAATKKEIPKLLDNTIQLFERGWYGTHDVTSDGINALLQNNNKVKEQLEN